MAKIDMEKVLMDKDLDNCIRIPKTKIICTLGPKSRDVPILQRLLKAGMNVARFNFSHGSHEYHQHTLHNLRTAMENMQIMCSVMLDTKGPEIRTGFLKDGKPIKLVEGQEIIITTNYDIEGDSSMIGVTYKRLAMDVKPGMTILCSDGTVTFTVISCDEAKGTVKCRCENNAVLGERKNVNLPGVNVDLPTITDRDREDILNWGVPNKIDFIAASFVRKGQDIVNIRDVLGKHAKTIQIISKVENQEGLVNFDDILAETDAVMVARGDLGMEIPTEKIFLAQKVMIYKCNQAGKPVITATQMLESMIKDSRPSRAEVTDVGNAVIDGTDAVMLSCETAAGQYPEEAVHVMADICMKAESVIDYQSKYTSDPLGILESLALTAARTAKKVRASLVMVLTRTGNTARLVAKYRPSVPIVSVIVPTLTANNLTWKCSDESPAHHSLICRGLIPILSDASARSLDSDTSDELIQSALKKVVCRGLCKPGDTVVALHGIGRSSLVRVIQVNSNFNS
eukprot:Gb_23818 [translate_table: standard]